MRESTPEVGRRRRGVLSLALAGAIGALALAFAVSPSVAAFTASITNSINTAGTGALTMQESNQAGTVLCNSTDGASVSTNSATCATINKYGGNLGMVPGQTVTTTVNIKNTGTVPASAFALSPSACAQSVNGPVNGTATDLCAQMTVVVTSGSTTIYSGSLASFTAPVNILTKLGTSSVAAGDSVPFVFAVTLPSSAGGTYAGLQVSQPLAWSFNS